jgi:hypothetical protein
VRRAFLCGEEAYSGQSFEHRRVWIVERMRLLSQVFAIDVCAYAIMSNHYHLVLYVDTTSAKSWIDEEVAQRWTALYKAPMLVTRWLKGEIDALPRKGLAGFLGNERERQPCFGVEFSLLDYLALVEELGRVIRPNKRGYIRASSHTLLERLDINSEEWLRLSESFGSKFSLCSWLGQRA